jgi:hypothetical protein
MIRPSGGQPPASLSAARGWWLKLLSITEVISFFNIIPPDHGTHHDRPDSATHLLFPLRGSGAVVAPAGSRPSEAWICSEAAPAFLGLLVNTTIGRVKNVKELGR